MPLHGTGCLTDGPGRLHDAIARHRAAPHTAVERSCRCCAATQLVVQRPTKLHGARIDHQPPEATWTDPYCWPRIVAVAPVTTWRTVGPHSGRLCVGRQV